MPKAVPKPSKDSINRVSCSKCGTFSCYSLEEMNRHQDRCKAAKQQSEQAAKAKAGEGKQSAHRR